MKKITISVREKSYEIASIEASKSGWTVGDLVREFLDSFGTHNAAIDDFQIREKRLREQARRFAMTDRLARDEIYLRR